MAKCGAKTEIYSRVCGYFRPVSNWNQGKREEFKDRKEYEVPDFTKKEERDRVRDDFRTPFGKKLEDITLPYRLEDKDKFEDLF